MEQVFFNNAAVNIGEIKERVLSIESYVDEQFLSLNMINLLSVDDVEPGRITFYGMLVSAICIPVPIRKIRLANISEALKVATHGSFAECSEQEYNDLINHIAGEIVDYKVLTGNENKYNASRNIALSSAKKLAGKILKPIVGPFKAPANLLMLKWIFAGIHQALVRYLINVYIFQQNHGRAVSEACKGYEDVISKKFKGTLGLT